MNTSTASDSTASHTPGPWRAHGLAIYAEHKYNTEFSGRLRDFNQPICMIVGNPAFPDAELIADSDTGKTARHPGWEEATANARLIAAAPAMLAALQALVHPMASDEDVDHARDVIAAATASAQ